jgi:hypothetical protein
MRKERSGAKEKGMKEQTRRENYNNTLANNTAAWNLLNRYGMKPRKQADAQSRPDGSRNGLRKSLLVQNSCNERERERERERQRLATAPRVALFEIQNDGKSPICAIP